MKIENMRYFLEVCKTLSLTKTADALYISRQNLGFIIRNLEEEIETQLFFRNNKGLTLTAEGELFLKYAQQCVALYDEFLEEKNHSTSNIVDFYTTPMLSNLVEEALIGELLHSNVYLNIQKYQFKELLTMMQENIPGIYFIGIDEEELAIPKLKDAVKLASEDMIVQICHKDYYENQTYEENIDIISSGNIDVLTSTNTKNVPKRTLNIDNFDHCKRLMEQKGIVLRTTELFYNKFFSDSQWAVIERRPAIFTIDYVLYVNLSHSKKRGTVEKELTEKLKLLLQ